MAQTTGLFFHDPGTQDGYVLFSPNGTDDTYLIDKNGSVVHQWDFANQPGLLGYLQPDGSLIRAAAAASGGQGGNGLINAAGAGGRIEWVAWDGDPIWSFDYGVSDTAPDSRTHLQHHDFEVMPNGNILLIAWEYKTAAEAIAAGRDPATAGTRLYPDSIVEVQPDLVNGGGTIVWEWHVWDHLIQDFDATKANYGVVADYPGKININFTSIGDEGAGAADDWTHANGIDYNAELDQIALSVREFSEFWIIDHNTTTAEAAGPAGDLLYRWGNPEAYGRGDASDRVLYYQHDIQWIPDGLPGAGNMTMFNNGFGRPGTDFSEVVEIVPPVDEFGNYPVLGAGETYGPAAPVWTYTAAAEDFSNIISGAQRLPNGNTLIDFGVDATMKEVTPAGVELWKYVSPYWSGGTLGPEDPIPPFGFLGLSANFAFQALHYPAAYTQQLTSMAAGRKIFYNQSTFDGNDPAVNAADASAIAPDKSAYLPGTGQAVLSNLTNFTNGITGIMLDLGGGGNHAAVTASDFIFKVGTNNSPSTWAAAPAPSDVVVTLGGGAAGSDRVTITWPEGAIKNTWLEVQVLSNTNTGLATTDVHFWGNLVGETASATPAGSFARTVAADGGAILTNGTQFNVGITNRLDINKSNAVTIAADRGPILTAGTLFLTRISIPGSGPFAPEAPSAPPANEDSHPGAISAVAAALASPQADSSLEPPAPRTQNRRVEVDRGPGPSARLADDPDKIVPRDRRTLIGASRAVDLALDEELFDWLSAATRSSR